MVTSGVLVLPHGEHGEIKSKHNFRFCPVQSLTCPISTTLRYVMYSHTSLLHCFKVKVKGRGSRSKVGVKDKVTGQGQIFGMQQSTLGARLMPSAAKSNNHHYQSKVIVCESRSRQSSQKVERMLVCICMEKQGFFWLEAWSMDSNKKGLFLKVDLHGF